MFKPIGASPGAPARALSLANEHQHEFVTLEHLLLSLIDEILELRRERATLLRFDSFAEMSVETKMADVAAVERMFDLLRNASWDAGQSDLEDLRLLAADRGRIDAAELLLARGAKVDADNRQGVTPLMQAAASGWVEMVRLLLKRGADPSRQDYSGFSALDWAERSNQRRTAEVLRRTAPR